MKKFCQLVHIRKTALSNKYVSLMFLLRHPSRPGLERNLAVGNLDNDLNINTVFVKRFSIWRRNLKVALG